MVDVGAGTGRVSVGLAGAGLRVVAVEPSVAMLGVLRGKGHGVLAVAGEGGRLPLRAASADAVVVARLLYLVPDWRGLLREAARVLRPGGVLLHEWGNGEDREEWVAVREKARALFEGAGVAAPFHPGARREGEVDLFLGELGFVRRGTVEGGAGAEMTLGAFLEKVESGEVSYIWGVPRELVDACLPELRRWCEGQFDLGRVVAMPRVVRWGVWGR